MVFSRYNGLQKETQDKCLISLFNHIGIDKIETLPNTTCESNQFEKSVIILRPRKWVFFGDFKVIHLVKTENSM